MRWDARYVAAPSLHLAPRGFDRFEVRGGRVTFRHAEVDAGLLRLLSHFAAPATPAEVRAASSGWFDAADDEFAAVLDTMLEHELLTPCEAPADRPPPTPAAADENTRWALSRHTRVLPAGERHAALLHPLHDGPELVDLPVADLVERLAAPKTADELAAEAGVTPRAARAAVEHLAARGFVHPDGDDDTARVHRALAERAPRPAPAYRPRAATALDDLAAAPAGAPRPVAFLVLGSCFAQLAAGFLAHLAPRYGLAARAVAGFPGDLHLVDSERPDVVVLQCSAEQRFLAPLWDEAPFLDPAERARRVAAMRDEARARVEAVRARSRGALLVVQGFSAPAVSPLGRAEFRLGETFGDAVHGLNAALRELVRDDPDALFLDEEAALSAEGKLRLLDDAVAPYSHHGPLDDAAPRLLAREYLDAYALWSGVGRVKCVVVDLDGVLWPWVVGEGDARLDDDGAVAALREGVHGGIHQALRILKARGVLLATASRNDERDVTAFWERLERFADANGLGHLLRRDDFALHRVGWGRKSASVAEVVDALGVALDAVLFVDDSAAERAEVAAALPAVRTLGADLAAVRRALLTDPGLDVSVLTPEARERTGLARRQAELGAALRAAGGDRSYLRGLGVRLRVTRLSGGAGVPRVVELLQRTTQFNTTLLRCGGERVAAAAADPDCAAYALEVEDRHAAYGLVGACLVERGRVEALALSCRVIALEVAVPFLAAALRDHGRAPVAARVVEGPRNHPCRDVFRQAGFADRGGGEFVLERLADLAEADPSLHAVTVAR